MRSRQPIKSKLKIIDFLFKYVDLNRFQIKIFRHSTHNTLHIEIWPQQSLPDDQCLWCLEWYPSRHGHIEIPAELCVPV